MSRPSSVSPRPPAPGGGGGGGGTGGGGGGPAPCGPGGGGRAKGLKDIRIDEEVKIAVNIALERFRYGDQRGAVPDRDLAGRRPFAPGPQLDPLSDGAAPEKEGRPGPPTWQPSEAQPGLERGGAPTVGSEEPQAAVQVRWVTDQHLPGIRRREGQVAPKREVFLFPGL
ncbi:class E basic helix-loop-helix protein 22-like [Ictidomys tridecemlineatus]|uniref:class E basic helix-loop-helix protein 22-like n=1 Tax=Ictidomys tridecemlineatus TaxID=43179 RepID=UPI000B547BCA|nr:class E basic helix-loop-helix protein 22-like [Ictidomys tridecemlineatus]KAG3265834.1 class E basic helix-loop-helix protein 22-like [Ictidomys tridecemlineatus]